MLMKKIILLLIFLIFCSVNAFSETLSDDEIAELISTTFTENALSTLSGISYQSASQELVYWDTSKGRTVLENVPVGRIYRIINNQNEYSPYWIAVKAVGTYNVEVSLGYLAKPTYMWYLGSKENSLIEFDCDTGLLADNAIELYDIEGKRKKLCETVEVELLSVNEDNTVSLAVSYNASAEKGIPEVKSLGDGNFLLEVDSMNPAEPVLYKLEGLPIYIFYYESVYWNYGEGSKTYPSLEFSYSPRRDLIDLLISNRIIVEEGRAFVGNAYEFSINDSFLGLKPSSDVLVQKQELALSIYTEPEAADYARNGKLEFSLINIITGTSYYLNLNSYKSVLSGKVPKGNYQLKAISNPNDSVLKDWVSDVFEVNSDNTVIDLRNEMNVKEETVEVEIIYPEEVVNALQALGVIPSFTTIEGKEVDVAEPTVVKGGLADQYLSTLRVPKLDSAYVFSIPETDSTESFTDTIPGDRDSVITVLDSIVKQPVGQPLDTFKLTVIVGEENYKLLEKEGLGIITFKKLKEVNGSYVVSSEKFYSKVYFEDGNTNRFSAELPRKEEYTLIIGKSQSTRYYNYFNETKKTISQQPYGWALNDPTTYILLDGQSFARQPSLKDNLDAVGSTKASFASAPVSEEIKNLQIKSVNGKYAVKTEGIPAHIVYLDKGTQKIVISLQDYSEGKIFFSLGEKGKVSQLKTATENEITFSLLDESKIELSMQEIKNGIIFSLDSYSGQDITINAWDGSTLQFFACQDKTADGKCDLVGYNADKTEKHGATFVEPNLEAASIEIQEEKTVEGETAEIGITIECDLEQECPEEVVENALQEILKQFSDIKNLKLDPIPNYPDATRVEIQVLDEKAFELKPVKVEPAFDYTIYNCYYDAVPDSCDVVDNGTYICDYPQMPDSCVLVDDGSYVCDYPQVGSDSCVIADSGDYSIEFTPVDSSLVLTPGKKESITFKANIKGKQATVVPVERFGEQSSDCIIAMTNAKKYETLIEKYSSQYGIDPNLIRAIIQKESSFVSGSIGKDQSGTGSSYGLMQIHSSNLDNWTDIFGDWTATNSWTDPEKSIKAGTRYFDDSGFADSVENWINSLGCDEKELNKIMPASGEAKATWKTALKLARYNTKAENVSCTEIKAVSTRTEYVPITIAWYRIFTENYGRQSELGDNYCKPTRTSTGTTIEVPEECKNCSTILTCLACMDYRFVSGVIESN